MTDKVKVGWAVDQDEVVLTVEIRMSGQWFLQRARQIYQTLSPARHPADRLLETESLPKTEKHITT